ncbi:MAG: substrate-binding domain-containing protein [Rhizobiales bacterium]|nr:substrate-binding domain-containing protein [Hyphomicrobiales bacterium]
MRTAPAPISRRLARLLALVATALTLGLGLGSCSRPGPEIAILAGSENKALEPLVQEFCTARGARCSFTYQGSLDIGFGLRATATPLAADIVWPAASIWIDLFDEGRRVRHLTSISQSPVVLGIRRSKAQALGWTTRDVTTADIIDAVERGDLKFLMSSATQSNSGAGAYLAMLTTAVGRDDVLTEAALASTEVRRKARALLRGVERSSGSSGWLGELFLDQDQRGIRYDAMWNYEAVLKETNETLVARGGEPLWLVYPKDGVAVSDGPLGLVDRGRGQEVESFVLDLQKFLLSGDAQTRIAATGRRIPLGRADAARPVAEWNFDPSRPITAVRPPDPKVIWAALNLYQEALRRPSLSGLCLDVSGSMEGAGIRQLREAMAFLFTPETTRGLLVQWSPDDRIHAIPFASTPGALQQGSGAAPDQARLKAWGAQLRADGGTDMYACARAALRAMAADLGTGKFLGAIVIMTDGRSQGDLSGFLADWRRDGHKVPVFGITFGDADRSQLDHLAGETGGRVFDGRSGLVEAFRAVRGYN